MFAILWQMATWIHWCWCIVGRGWVCFSPLSLIMWACTWARTVIISEIKQAFISKLHFFLDNTSNTIHLFPVTTYYVPLYAIMEKMSWFYFSALIEIPYVCACVVVLVDYTLWKEEIIPLNVRKREFNFFLNRKMKDFSNHKWWLIQFTTLTKCKITPRVVSTEISFTITCLCSSHAFI